MTSNVIDQPAKANEDRLNMKAYASALTEFIANAQSPLTIALQGEWGSGKTSLMNALEASLVDKEGALYLGVWINTWQYALMSNAEEAIRNILHGIIGQVAEDAKTTEEERKSLFRKIARIGGGVFSDLFKKYSGVDAERIVKELSAGEPAPYKSSVEDLKDELARLVKNAIDNNKDKGKRGFLFFIDDLDRIDPPVAVQILELLKNIFDLENCIFVLAIDYGVVVKGLKPKFGAMTPENEREFRSFFDKIIQLPFQMPVGSYQIDDFLIGSLVAIGYLDNEEKADKTLCDSLTAYALASVGTNPRSLKRLINTLSLIWLLILRTQTKEDEADFKAWKDVTFALVCLQIQYPQVYSALERFPDFDKWDDRFAQTMQLQGISEDKTAKLAAMEEFDEPWEQMLFRFCRKDTFLEARTLKISRVLNKIKTRIIGANEIVGDTVEQLLRLSAVTNVKSEPSDVSVIEEFSPSEYLKALRGQTFRLYDVWTDDGAHGWEGVLTDSVYLSSWQTKVKKNLRCELWVNQNTFKVAGGDFLTEPTFYISHDGKSFNLNVNGEFWGNWPEEKFKGIDFTATDIQRVLSKALAAICEAWSGFDVKGDSGCNPGDNVGSGDIWWNAAIPFKDLDELVSEEFSKKLCGSLAKVAAAFATLLPYRVSVNNNK